MELHAYTRTISDLFSVKRKYVAPRFQREYSWSKEQVRELWDDVITNIKVDDAISHEEYFIGALVLVGDETSNSLQIVDGQQRLTTITILLSVLCDKFLELRKRNLAEAIYNNYIAGRDDDGKNYFRLENETPKPFFQKNIQHLDKLKEKPQSEEEKTLLNAYNEFSGFTSRQNISRLFSNAEKIDDEKYERLLKAVRDQIVSYLKVIFITVREEEEAYTIFETLNARGMSLSFVDLIKNKIFKELSHTHPDDDAKTAWKNIRVVLSSRENVGSLETFVRHWWLSKYSYASADNVYKNFKKLWKEGAINAKEFIDELNSDASVYIKIASPIHEDFMQQEERAIFSSLLAFKIFGIMQQRSFLLSLFKVRAKGFIKLSELKSTLEFLEMFHFKFNAVCSMRPSGLESTYSRTARELQKVDNRKDANAVIQSLKSRFTEKLPDKTTFIEKFNGLMFYKGFTKDKKTIQYIFNKIEQSKKPTNEWAPENISIEHILSQSKGEKEIVGKIGNLLPLGQELNEEAENNDVVDKIPTYKKSQFSLPIEFSDKYTGEWDEDLISQRTIELAEYCYNNIWE